MRAGDKDRELVAEQLRSALSEGRLTLVEYDERLQQAYAARTYGDLDGILDDLPGVIPVSASQVVPAGVQPDTEPAGHPHHGGNWLGPVWTSWASTGVVLIVIWALSDFGGYFWPAWVLGPWGAVLLLRTLAGWAGRGRGHNLRAATDAARDAAREARRTARERRRYGR